MDPYTEKLGSRFRLIPAQFKALKSVYLGLFSKYDQLLEECKKNESVIYGESQVDGENVTIKLCDDQVYQLHLTPIYCTSKTHEYEINGRISFTSHNLLGEAKLVGSLIIRSATDKMDIYSETGKFSLGKYADPYTINTISAWLLNCTIEHIKLS